MISEYLEQCEVNKKTIKMTLEENYRLNNQVEIPKIGLGTWFINDEDAVQVVKDAT